MRAMRGSFASVASMADTAEAADPRTYAMPFSATVSALAPPRLLCPLGFHATESEPSSLSGTLAAARPAAWSAATMVGRARVVPLTTRKDPPSAAETARMMLGSTGWGRRTDTAPSSRPSLMEPTFMSTPEGT